MYSERDNAVVPLAPSQTEAAADVLARAFADDPLTEYLFGGRDIAPARLSWLHGTALRFAMRAGRVDTSADIRGVAAWLPPGGTELTVPGMLRAGMLAAPVRLGLAACFRLLRYDRERRRLHAGSEVGRHWYLLILGVDPVSQRGGTGRALLERGLEEADISGLPCYLETTNPRSVPFYERHGFRSCGSARVAAGLEIRSMLRPPRPRQVDR